MTTATSQPSGSTGPPVLTTPARAPGRDQTAGSKPFKGNSSRWLTPAIVIGLLLAVTFALTLLTGRSQGSTDDLDPANPGFSGAQGLANVLRDHGITVTVVRGQRELLAHSIDGGTTVAIASTIRLSGRTAQAAMAHAVSGGALVLLDPDAEVIRGMGLPVTSHLADLTNVAAGCQGTQVGKAFRLARADQAYATTSDTTTADTTATNPIASNTIASSTTASNTTTATTASATLGPISCFPDKADGGAAMVALPQAAGRPPVTLLGDDSLISNGAILHADNAAIALRLFGQSDHLVWYVPSLADISAADASSRSIAPAWFQPGLALATSAVVFLCLWRGRRLGPLVTEPLPVIVRAIETTESRGRMYRKSRDRTRALAVLQLATRRRLAAYLGLTASSSLRSVAAAAAAVSGRTYRDVLELLSSPAAYDDSSLLVRANTLAALEKEVRRR